MNPRDSINRMLRSLKREANLLAPPYRQQFWYVIQMRAQNEFNHCLETNLQQLAKTDQLKTTNEPEKLL